MWWRKENSLREQCRRKWKELAVPQPVDMASLTAVIEETRGRRIQLQALPENVLGGTDICGLWLKHARQPLDLILYAAGTTAAHQKHIMLHEYAHLLFDDPEESSGWDRGVSYAERRSQVVPEGMPGACLDDSLSNIAPGLIKPLSAAGMVMARSSYASLEERRAETMAYFMEEAMGGEFITDAQVRNLSEDLFRRRSY